MSGGAKSRLGVAKVQRFCGDRDAQAQQRETGSVGRSDAERAVRPDIDVTINTTALNLPTAARRRASGPTLAFSRRCGKRKPTRRRSATVGKSVGVRPHRRRRQSRWTRIAAVHHHRSYRRPTDRAAGRAGATELRTALRNIANASADGRRCLRRVLVVRAGGVWTEFAAPPGESLRGCWPPQIARCIDAVRGTYRRWHVSLSAASSASASCVIAAAH